MSQKNSRRKFSLEYRQKLVGEFLSGGLSAQQLAQREGITPGQIYRWKTQLEDRSKLERAGELEAEGMSQADARRFREMEEELEAYKAKVAEQAMAIDLLKKLHPSFQSERKSSGYAEIRRKLDRSRGRAR